MYEREEQEGDGERTPTTKAKTTNACEVAKFIGALRLWKLNIFSIQPAQNHQFLWNRLININQLKGGGMAKT